MDQKEQKGFFQYFEECWSLHKDLYPEKEIDPEEFRQQGLLKWNAASDAKKARFFEEDDDNKETALVERVNLSDCFINFSRQMKESVSAPGDSVRMFIVS